MQNSCKTSYAVKKKKKMFFSTLTCKDHFSPP